MQRTLVPRWVQLVLLPISLLALWALAKAAGKVLLIFVVAAVIALILNPAVAFVQRPRVPRGLAVLVVYLAFFLTLVGIGFLLANPIANQVRTFTDNLPHIINEANNKIAEVQSYLDQHGIHLHLVKQGKTALQSIEAKVAKSSSKLASSSADLLTEAASAISTSCSCSCCPCTCSSTASTSAGSYAGRCPTGTARPRTTIRPSSSAPSPATWAASCCSAC